MKSQTEIEEAIKEIEDKMDPEDECSYLDEGDQAYLQALYWVLDEN